MTRVSPMPITVAFALARARYLRVARSCGLAVAFAAAGSGAAVADPIDRFMAQTQRVYGLPALVVGVYRDGRLADARARGQANVELQVPARAGQAFEIGSISKQFTAYAVLILREQGLIELDAPVGRYLADLPEDWASVSLHRLLTHTSGLPDLEEAFGYGVYRETPSDEEFARRLYALPIESKPGEKWHYANTNYWLLARVIEKVAGMPYADFMASRIFKPLGMRHTRSALPGIPLAGRASGYRRVGGRLENRDPIQPNTGRGLGDITSTVEDFARWEREQLSPRLISAASAALARQPVMLEDGTQSPYGYGWFTDPMMPEATQWHTGQTAGFTAVYMRIPGRRVAVVVLTNSYAAPVESVAKFVARQAVPALRVARPKPITDTEPSTTRRIAELYGSAGHADTAWQPEWFTAEHWSDIGPWLSEVAEFYRQLGPVRQVTLVGRSDEAGQRQRVYRITYAQLTRLATIKFDEQGRIASRAVDDE